MKQNIVIGGIIGMAFAFVQSLAQSTTVGAAMQTDSLNKVDTIPPKIIGSIYIELGGNALFYSVNYEHVLKTAKKYKLALRGGFGFVPRVGGEVYFPLELNYYRKKSNSLELGIGFTPSYADWKEAGFGGTKEKTFQGITTLRLGYRFFDGDRRWMVRVGVLLLWRSVFFNQHQQRIFFYEKRDYYSKLNGRYPIQVDYWKRCIL